MKTRLLPEVSVSPDDSFLTLELSSLQTVSTFADKLKALTEIYEELCILMNIPASSYPLRIVKVESGSLWAKVFGKSKVVAMMCRLIESGVQYLHRNYTREGRVQSIPRKVEVIESLLGLRSQLADQGISTENLDDQINKAAVQIGSNLNNLLADEPTVSVNGTVHSVSADILHALELRGDKKLLTEFDSDVPDLVIGDEKYLLPPNEPPTTPDNRPI